MQRYRRASVFEGREEERLVGHTLPKDRAPPLPVAWGHGLTYIPQQTGTSAFPHAKKSLRGRRILEQVCPIFVFLATPLPRVYKAEFPSERTFLHRRPPAR